MASQVELMKRWNKRIQEIQERCNADVEDEVAAAEYSLLAECMEELGFMTHEMTPEDIADRELIHRVADTIRKNQDKINLEE